jgi:hypothetical protein
VPDSVVTAPPPRLTPAQRKRRNERTFRPIAIELGWLAYEWNRLQEALAELFSDFVSKDNLPMGFAVWYSVPSDRTQRDMLRAALEIAYQKSSPKPQPYSEIVWILGELNSLAGKRNTALHVPLIFVTDVMLDEVEILPKYFFGNPHARQLSGKELIEEFKWYRGHLSRLAHFAEALHYAVTFPDYALPERPQLPPRGRYQSHKARRRKK